MKNQNGRTDDRLQGYRLVDRGGRVALFFPESIGAPEALDEEECAWVWRGKLYVTPGQSVGEVPLGPLMALLERAEALVVPTMQPDTDLPAVSGADSDRQTPEPQPERVEIDGVVVDGGVKDSEPYIARENGIETVAVYQASGDVYFPCGCFIPSLALVELLRRSGALGRQMGADKSGTDTGAPADTGRASLEVRRRMLSAMQEAADAIEYCRRGAGLPAEEVQRLKELLDEAYMAVLDENEFTDDPASWAFGL